MKWDLTETICVVDTETTGTSETESTILTVGATIVGGIYAPELPDHDLPEYYGECWPGGEWFADGKADRALSFNGLDRHHLEDQQDQDAMADAFYSFMLQNQCTKITAFNVLFDRKFLKREPFNIVEPEFEWVDCIMVASRIYRKKHELPGRKYNLNFMADHFNLKRQGRDHHAGSDARLAKNVMLELMKPVGE